MIETYDPAQVITIFGGIVLYGYAEGTMVQVSRNADSFTGYVGTDGEVARVANADKSGTVKVTLAQTSPCNDMLSAEHALDELTRRNVKPIFVKDASGRTRASGPEAWIQKPADVTLGSGIEGREWTFYVANLDTVVGGN